MTQLGRVHGQRALSLTEIASIEHLPLPYLEQVIGPLRRDGLVEGTRGAHGGYRLTRDPAAIRASEIVSSLEGPDATAPVECVAESYVDGNCVREAACLSRPLWSRLKAAYDEVLYSTTLADLCRDSQAGPTFINLAPEILALKEQPVGTHG
jgi:Rrf2 family protein